MAHRSNRRPRSLALLMLLCAAWLVVVATPASAACHVAVFVEPEVEAHESDGTVSLVVELQGRVDSCAGTVDVTTVDGTAVAGEDYEAVDRTLTFVEGDDRVETVDVAILADGRAEDPEVFTVELSDPTGSISSTGGPATVRITDDGATDEPTATDEEPTATDEATPVGTPPPPADDEDGGPDLLVVLAVVVVAGLGIAAYAVLRGRER